MSDKSRRAMPYLGLNPLRAANTHRQKKIFAAIMATSAKEAHDRTLVEK
jgi:hypothetical protein